MTSSMLARMALIGVLVVSVSLQAQSTNMIDHRDGQIEQASCTGCGGCNGCSSNYTKGASIWGTYCMDGCCPSKPGLYPPCPNPCRNPLSAISDLACAVDSSVTNIFGCLLGCGRGAFGSSSCEASCGADAFGFEASCGADACAGCENCSQGGIIEFAPSNMIPSQGVPTQAVPMGTPIEQPVPAHIQPGNPFGDEPGMVVPQGSTSRFENTKRFRELSSRSKKIRQASYQKSGSTSAQVRKVSASVPAEHQDPAVDRRPKSDGHFAPRKSTKMKRGFKLPLPKISVN